MCAAYLLLDMTLLIEFLIGFRCDEDPTFGCKHRYRCSSA